MTTLKMTFKTKVIARQCGTKETSQRNVSLLDNMGLKRTSQRNVLLLDNMGLKRRVNGMYYY